MSDYAEELVRQWELNDPRDRWRHTGGQPPHSQSRPLAGWKPTEDMARDIDRMLFCHDCGADACFGFDVTLEGVRMGDVGAWRCAEHHPERRGWYSCADWASAHTAGRLYPPADLPADHGAREGV